MRGFDRDLIRGGHYGQRSCEPHKQAEHMAAPTQPAGVKKVLANPEPSTHGTSRTSHDVCFCAATGGQADIKRVGRASRFMSTRAGASVNGFLRGCAVLRDASPEATGV